MFAEFKIETLVEKKTVKADTLFVQNYHATKTLSESEYISPVLLKSTDKQITQLYIKFIYILLVIP